MPCLWTQDLAEFFSAVAECESDVVVAVGHNPFMEDAVAQVCGQAVPLATGAIAAVRVNGEFSNGLPSEGRLLWVMQGPEVKRWKAMVDVEGVIAEAVDNVETRREAFFADPQDVEAAHKYRVSIRTIRGLLSFIEPFLQRDQYSRLQRDWKSLVLPTSRLREYDVLSAEVAQLEPRADALLEACAAARAKECDATLATLSSKSSRKCLERACEQSRNLVWKRSIEKKGLGSRAIAKRFERVVETSPLPCGKVVFFFQDKLWHPVRRMIRARCPLQAPAVSLPRSFVPEHSRRSPVRSCPAGRLSGDLSGLSDHADHAFREPPQCAWYFPWMSRGLTAPPDAAGVRAGAVPASEAVSGLSAAVFRGASHPPGEHRREPQPCGALPAAPGCPQPEPSVRPALRSLPPPWVPPPSWVFPVRRVFPVHQR